MHTVGDEARPLSHEALWHSTDTSIVHLVMIEDVERHCGKDLAEPVGIAMVERADHVDVLRYMCEVPLYQGLSLALTTLKDVVQYLCELPRDQGVDPSAEGNHAIRASAAHGHVDVVRYLCELPRGRGVNPSAHCNFAIRAAAQHGHVDVVRCLCELPRDRGEDPSARHYCAIRAAARHGHVDVVRYLCELPRDRGEDPSPLHSGVIWLAAQHGHVDVVRYLCELPSDRGADPQPCRITIESKLFRPQLQVVRYLCCLPVMQSTRAATSMYNVGSPPTIPKHAHLELDNCFESMTARRTARLPVLALCALVRGAHHRGTRLYIAMAFVGAGIPH